MNGVLAQVGIAAFGVAAIWLSQSPTAARRRWACVVGLAAQPFWFYATWTAGQYGIFALTFLYTLSWLRGIHTHWLSLTGNEMNKTVSVGRFFACLASQGSGSPLVDRAMTTEKDGEKRSGRGFLIRLPFTGNRPTVGLVVGRWKS